ncbi:MAG: Gfo/Idh/MocA family oxidoreductase [Nitrososphaerota archaeon]|nr:Gfo/Idh/MocA family oxidoreductase [Candidatus Calditenuaceae archaeon]MDW8073762.1 Gfo/Idh/MocA family oxidoreductase [Nitrososphaerota archaeon]
MAGLRVGVVGAGRMGVLHAKNLLANVEDVEIPLIVDTVKESAERLAGAVRARHIYDSLEEADLSLIDAAIVSIPNVDHYSVVSRLVSRGVHVLCEKPLGLRASEAYELAKVSERRGVVLQVGYNRRFDPAYQRCKRLVEDGRLGRVLHVRSQTMDPEPPRGWEADPRLSGGIVFTTCCHDFNLLSWLTGEAVTEVFAAGSLLVHSGALSRDDYDNISVFLKFESGATGFVFANRFCTYGHDVRTEVHGERLSLRVEQEKMLPLNVYGGEGVVHDYPYWYMDRFRESYINEINAFVECVKTGSRPLSDAVDAAKTLEICEAATLSAKSGSPVKLRPEG